MRDRLLGKIFQFRKDHTAATAAAAAATTTPKLANSTAGQGDAADAAAVAKAAGHFSMIGQVNVEERDYALLYAYALVTGQVAEELKVVGEEIERLFGVLHEELLLLQ